MSAPLLEVRDLVRHYERPRRNLFTKKPVIEALRGVSFSVRAGESFGIVGESGSGKSTLARAILALEEPTAGSVRLMGHNLFDLSAERRRAMRRHVQMVFQDPFGSLDPRQTVRDIVTEPLDLLDDIGAEEWEQRAEEALTSVGLQAGALDKFPHEFSGGQRQRIAIARALITKPDLIVADEPVSALDVSVQAQVLNLMMDLQERFNLTYIIISHDLSVVRHVTDRVAVMETGEIVEQGNTADIFERPRHSYTRELLDSVLDVPDPIVIEKGPARNGRPDGVAETPATFDHRTADKPPAKAKPTPPPVIKEVAPKIMPSEKAAKNGQLDERAVGLRRRPAAFKASTPANEQKTSEADDHAAALLREIEALKAVLPSDEEDDETPFLETKAAETEDHADALLREIEALKAVLPSDEEEGENETPAEKAPRENQADDHAAALLREIEALKASLPSEDDEDAPEETSQADQTAPPVAVDGDVTKNQNLIYGRWQDAIEQETIKVINPSDGETFSRLARGKAADIDLAVKAAHRAMDGPWGRTPAFQRGRVLARLAGLVLENVEHLAILEAKDVGKPLRQARADAVALSRYFEFYGGAADKVHGETIPYHEGYTVLTLREPHGVTGHIVPWNYPMQIIGRSVGAALAMGNTCVLKPGEDASLTALEIGKLALEAGLPPGVLNIVTGLGEEAGAALAAHPGIDHLSFTGSVETGRIVQQAAARHSCPVTLELGGKSPQIVFADADLDKALPFLVNAAIQNAGQTCSAGSRVLIQAAIYDDVAQRLAERFDNLGVGPAERDLDCGPVINPTQKTRIEGYLKRAKTDGIDILGEGELAPDTPKNGHYVRPTLLGNVAPDHVLAQEEIFGPVLTAIRFTNEDDAISIANNSPYGLVAGIWTNDGARQMRLARAIKTGQVFINNYGAGGGVELPFGGVKNSGFGREKGFEALYGFSTLKTVAIHHG